MKKVPQTPLLKALTATDFIDKRILKIQMGLKIKMKDIGRGTIRNFTVDASTFLICKHLNAEGQPFKIFIFERLKADKPIGRVSYDIWENESTTKHPNVEYRFGYFIIGKNGNKKGKWTWGQFCPMIGHNDFKELVYRAHKEGTILE